jgi:cytochrome c556
MKRIVTLALVGLLSAAGAAGAQAPAGPSSMEIVQARKAAMALSGVATASMKASIDAGQSPRTQAFAAGSMARWGQALPGMFPAGSGTADLAEGATNAKPEIWSDRSGFEARAADYVAAAARLQELARADDAAGFAAQWTVVRQTCQACHDAYKAG